jgi:hypothetical protein
MKMKVKELIEKLQQFDPELPVGCSDELDNWEEITDVFIEKYAIFDWDRRRSYPGVWIQ